MFINESLNQFYSRFSSLESKVRIEQPEQLRDIFRKLHPDLYQTSLDIMAMKLEY